MTEPVSEKLDDQWRMRCPEGHPYLRDQSGPTVYCEECNSAYRYEDLIDGKEQYKHMDPDEDPIGAGF